MAQKPSIPKGTRDFLPEEMARRNYIFDTIKRTFQKFGFLPIETPAMENLSTLMGKYGEEGDKLLFKILNSGDFLNKADEKLLAEKESTKVTNQISEKGLRYDLTVPFARFVVQHRNEIDFPFKRYQIQPVWRADRPQKGRYREFFQCDVDVVGSDSLLNEVELIQILEEVFTNLQINVVVKINNRKILAGIAEVIGEAEKIIDITVAIDKLDKIGREKVIEELKTKEISDEAIEKLQPIFDLSGSTTDKLEALKTILATSETGLKGIEEMRVLFDYMEMLDVKVACELDLTLARGLNYYTGAIFEVKALDVAIGSICGGGRYDNLTSVFGLNDVSGVGISFGADRIYDVLNQLDLYPKEAISGTTALFINFGIKEEAYCLSILKQVRNAGISSEIYPSSAKLKKQMSYADNKKIPYVILAGDNEIAEGKVTLKNMASGEQMLVTPVELIAKLKG